MARRFFKKAARRTSSDRGGRSQPTRSRVQVSHWTKKVSKVDLWGDHPWDAFNQEGSLCGLTLNPNFKKARVRKEVTCKRCRKALGLPPLEGEVRKKEPKPKPSIYSAILNGGALDD